jgi:glycosyltransferase involved in cell wall biosynthesis
MAHRPTNHRCCLVIPTYNAAKFIAQSVIRLKLFTEDHPDWKVLFVTDGCSDNTVEVLKELISQESDSLFVYSYDRNRGKGYALRQGLDLANVPYLIYTDADLAYDPDEAIKLLRLMEEGADLALVNRAHPQSRFIMTPLDFPRIYKRHLASRTFNWWLRQMLPIKALDTQAGLKGITQAAWKKIRRQMTTEGFFFDVEFLARAGQAGMKLAEIPTTVTYVDPTTVKMVSHGSSMFIDTLKLRWNLWRNPSPAYIPETPEVSQQSQ